MNSDEHGRFERAWNCMSAISDVLLFALFVLMLLFLVGLATRAVTVHDPLPYDAKLCSVEEEELAIANRGK